MRPQHWRKSLPVYLLFIIAFPLGMLWVETRRLDGPTICIFRLTTHLDCPTCGMTRAFRAMGRLDVREAFNYNPLSPAVFLGALALWGYATAMVVSGGRIQPPEWWTRWHIRIIIWTVAVTMVLGVVRIGYQLQHPPPPPQVPFLSGR
ncbi:MAG: DUF2752 domain-containing protein [Armatimonadota bacterium]